MTRIARPGAVMGGLSRRITSLVLGVLLSTSIRPTVAQEQLPQLPLETAIATALENSTRLTAARASVDLGHAKLQNTRSVRFPKVATRFVYPFIATESGVSMNQRLWDFKQTHYLVDAGQAQIQSSISDAATQREEIIFNTKVAYYTVLAQQALVAAAAQMVQEHATRVEQADSLARLGRIPQIDTAKARINFGNVQPQARSIRSPQSR